jgi:hypothetical protein
MDFDTIEKGTYRFKIREAAVEPQGEGKASGKRYWARCVVVGGSQDGLSHIESFFQKTKDNFSKRKMAGFLIKVGFIKNPAGITSEAFDTPEFEERFKKTLPGKEFGAKIGWRYDDKDTDKEKPRSQMNVYYSLDEYMATSNKNTATASPVTGQPEVQQGPPAPTAPPAAAIWD